MTDLQRQQLYERNNKIIEIVLEQIKKECPESVDLIGIGGSFCNGDIYENSDLDLVIIQNDEKAGVLCKCFILGNVGFDIYTQNWNRFEELAKYNHPYVTKLFDLDLIYIKNDEVQNKYNRLRDIVRQNMQNESNIIEKIQIHYNELMSSYKQMEMINDLSISYTLLAKILKEAEFIIYMLNQTYVRRGTKRVPEEILSMNILPTYFKDIYLSVPFATNISEIKIISKNLTDKITQLLNSKNITCEVKPVSLKQPTDKEKISSDALTGTYEEIYSNYKNKMYHATNTNNVYLSFVTMAACQEFYDEMSMHYEIPSIDLIGSYNPNDLQANQIAFEQALMKWKELYDAFDKPIIQFATLEDLNGLYKKHI